MLALLGLHLAVELPLGRAWLELFAPFEEEVSGAPLEVDGELDRSSPVSVLRSASAYTATRAAERPGAAVSGSVT